MTKFTMKIFDNETGKLVGSEEFNVLIGGIAGRENDIGGSIVLCHGDLREIANALSSVDTAQQEIMRQDPSIGIAYALAKKVHKSSKIVCETPFQKVNREEEENNGES